MLKKTRIILASLFFLGITALLAGFGTEWLGWMAKIQFLPSVMQVIGSATALNIAVIAGILLLTLLFGRIYCSIICPLGVFQDIINNISYHRKGKQRRFRFKPQNKLLRYGILAVVIAAMISGLQIIVALIAPYSSYGRIVKSIVSPVGTGWAFLAVAGFTFIALFVLAWVGGRVYCNNICPVGTVLGVFSRFSLFKPVIDESVCVNCHGCEKKCKSSCIDSEAKKIDYSRCVTCFDCISDCKVGAIKYRISLPSGKSRKANAPVSSQNDAGRRAFIAGAAIALGSGTLKAQTQKLDGGLAEIADKKKPVREERIVPPGSLSIKNFYSKCTACQLCVSSCPNDVLRPSTDLDHFMQPESSYEKGYCRPECTICSQVCPSGAIIELTAEEKTAVHVGHAVVDLNLCLADSKGVSCGNCARHCPAGAIKMVRKNPSDRNSVLIPTVDEEKCIGCGACEFLCPSRPYSAIHVNGLKVHING